MGRRKKMGINEIIKIEREFRQKLLSVKPEGIVQRMWLPAFLIQSMLFEMQLLSQPKEEG